MWKLFPGGPSIRWAAYSSLRYGFLGVLVCSCLRLGLSAFLGFWGVISCFVGGLSKGFVWVLLLDK